MSVSEVAEQIKSQFYLISLKYFNFKKTTAYWKQVYFRHLSQSGSELTVPGMQQWFPRISYKGQSTLISQVTFTEITEKFLQFR